MESNDIKQKVFVLVTIGLAIAALIGFLIITKIAFSPLILFALCLFLLVPFRKESHLVRRLILLTVLLFVFWLVSFVPETFVSFLVAFLIAYLFDPIVNRFSGKFFPRWIISLFVIVVFIGIVTLISVFVFPSIFMQLNEVSGKVKSIVTTATSYFEVGKFEQLMKSIGIEDENLKNLIKKEFLPEIRSFLDILFLTLTNLLKGVSGIATQVLNAVLIPIFSFYFLKDFDRIKKHLKLLIGRKDPKMLSDIRRINDIFKVYIGWQVFAATMIATISSIIFTITGVESGILLGLLCGFLNPIPYIGLLASWILSTIILIVIAPENLLFQILVVILTVNILHFVNAYFVEPNILGHRIGLHPLILIASLFIFGALFGFIGLLIAVPCTATLMLFYNDWKNKLINEEQSQHKETVQDNVAG